MQKYMISLGFTQVKTVIVKLVKFGTIFFSIFQNLLMLLLILQTSIYFKRRYVIYTFLGLFFKIFYFERFQIFKN